MHCLLRPLADSPPPPRDNVNTPSMPAVHLIPAHNDLIRSLIITRFLLLPLLLSILCTGSCMHLCKCRNERRRSKQEQAGGKLRDAARAITTNNPLGVVRLSQLGAHIALAFAQHAVQPALRCLACHRVVDEQHLVAVLCRWKVQGVQGKKHRASRCAQGHTSALTGCTPSSPLFPGGGIPGSWHTADQHRPPGQAEHPPATRAARRLPPSATAFSCSFVS